MHYWQLIADEHFKQLGKQVKQTEPLLYVPFWHIEHIPEIFNVLLGQIHRPDYKIELLIHFIVVLLVKFLVEAIMHVLSVSL